MRGGGKQGIEPSTSDAAARQLSAGSPSLSRCWRVGSSPTDKQKEKGSQNKGKPQTISPPTPCVPTTWGLRHFVLVSKF